MPPRGRLSRPRWVATPPLGQVLVRAPVVPATSSGGPWALRPRLAAGLPFFRSRPPRALPKCPRVSVTASRTGICRAAMSSGPF
jgi:hypothetical protein